MFLLDLRVSHVAAAPLPRRASPLPAAPALAESCRLYTWCLKGVGAEWSPPRVALYSKACGRPTGCDDRSIEDLTQQSEVLLRQRERFGMQRCSDDLLASMKPIALSLMVSVPTHNSKWRALRRLPFARIRGAPLAVRADAPLTPSAQTPLDSSFWRPYSRFALDTPSPTVNQTSLIFVAGAEGTGHHFITAVRRRAQAQGDASIAHPPPSLRTASTPPLSPPPDLDSST
eukprot:3860307-Pleurochrysis_carterae.AAC.2